MIEERQRHAIRHYLFEGVGGRGGRTLPFYSSMGKMNKEKKQGRATYRLREKGDRKFDTLLCRRRKEKIVRRLNSFLLGTERRKRKWKKADVVAVACDPAEGGHLLLGKKLRKARRQVGGASVCGQRRRKSSTPPTLPSGKGRKKRKREKVKRGEK